MATSMPPLPPDVVAQQMPPAMQFMQGAGSAINSGQQFDPMALVDQLMNEVAAKLKQVADVLVLEKPQLMKVIEIMANAGSTIQNEVMASRQTMGAGPGEQGVNPQFAGPENTPAAVSMG